MKANVDKLTEILLNLTKTKDNKPAQSKSRTLFDQAEAAELAHAQENLLTKGVSAGRLWHVWESHKDLLPDQACKLRKQVGDDHILRRVIAEHDMVLCFISDLANDNQAVQKMLYGSSTSSEIRQIGHIARHLLAAEQHREREEHVILPLLRDKSYQRVVQLIELQHLEITRACKRLHDLVKKVDRTEFTSFKKQLDEIVRYLVPTMRIHIFVETSILFPLALEVVKDQAVWKRMKEFADQMGYCGYDANVLEEKNA